MQNQSNREITFDTQLKAALNNKQTHLTDPSSMTYMYVTFKHIKITEPTTSFPVAPCYNKRPVLRMCEGHEHTLRYLKATIICGA